ncbi:MAG: hypothetical protein LBN07_02260 [Christensenellaceae bacterium]|jgi:stage III sporulation protein AD|nr:hypothetical protein [Christensenellaceae bacterium]
MLDLFKILGVGIVTTVAVLITRQIKTEYAVFVGLAGSIIIVILIINQLSFVVGYFGEVINRTGLDPTLFTAILKIVGVGYITEFVANICSDAGSNSTGDKVLLAGKVVILCLALPIITALLDIVIGILP